MVVEVRDVSVVCVYVCVCVCERLSLDMIWLLSLVLTRIEWLPVVF